MAGILAAAKKKPSRIKPREGDLFTRTLVVAGEQALNTPEIGGQIAQLASSASSPGAGVGIALSVLLGNMRSSIVEQGKGLPMDVVFIPGGTADILAQDIAEDLGVPEEQMAAVISEGVQMAEQMLSEIDNVTQQSMQQQPPQGGQPPAPEQQGMTMPPGGGGSAPQAGGGILGGMQ